MRSSSQTLLRQSFDGEYLPASGIHEFISDLSGSTALTVPTGATKCIVQAEGQNVRWRIDAVAPTASVGHLIEANKSETFVGGLSSLRFIETASSGTLNVTFFADL